MTRPRIGIFGGTFDPVHIGHLVAAVHARHACGLDEVVFVPAGVPWQKADRVITPAEVRFAAVAAAIDGIEGLTVSRVEIDRAGPSYMVETVRHLMDERPDGDWFLILGADAAAGLETWQGWQQLAGLVTVVVLNRPGSAEPVLSGAWRLQRAEMPALEVSSTDLRARLQDGRPVDLLIPAAAAAVLRRSARFG